MFWRLSQEIWQYFSKKYMKPLIKINKKFSYTKKFSLIFNSNSEIKLVNIRQKDKKYAKQVKVYNL